MSTKSEIQTQRQVAVSLSKLELLVWLLSNTLVYTTVLSLHTGNKKMSTTCADVHLACLQTNIHIAKINPVVFMTLPKYLEINCKTADLMVPNNWKFECIK